MKKHLGMNSQVLVDTFGHLIGAPGAPPATVHELTADRTHDIAATIVAENTRWRADKAHQDASLTVHVPFPAGTCHRPIGHRPRTRQLIKLETT
ncbi:hypothetical protein ACFVS5_28570 [Streptomyces albidoflavus]